MPRVGNITIEDTIRVDEFVLPRAPCPARLPRRQGDRDVRHRRERSRAPGRKARPPHRGRRGKNTHHRQGHKEQGQRASLLPHSPRVAARPLVPGHAQAVGGSRLMRPQKISLLLQARRLREDQTFDFYAQRLEQIDGSLRTKRITNEEAEFRVAALWEEIEAVRAAIKDVQDTFVDINRARGI